MIPEPVTLTDGGEAWLSPAFFRSLPVWQPRLGPQPSVICAGGRWYLHCVEDRRSAAYLIRLIDEVIIL